MSEHEGGDPLAQHPPAVTVEIERALAALAMAVICVISFANVVVRYATNVSFAFTEEYSVFLLAFMTLVGASAAFARGAHIRIGMLVDATRGFWRRFWIGFGALASLLMFALVLYYGAFLAWDEFRFEETSPGMGHPTWIYTVWLPVLALAIMLRILGRWRRDVKALK